MNKNRKFTKHSIIALMAVTLITGCASSKNTNDPLEPANRAIYKFNDVVDGYVIKPLAQGYGVITPKFVQTGVSNFFSNIRYPVVFVNQFLQGKIRLGFQDTGRFLINTTFGIAGLFDAAGEFGLKEHKEDFGQTFGVWGFNTGPYIVIPLLGPSNLRDGIGSVADYYTEPVNNFEYFDDHRATKNKLIALGIIDQRAKLLEIEKLVSGDRYTFIRDAYMQKRADLVADGEAQENDPFLDDE